MNDDSKAEKAILVDDILKPRWYTLFISLMAELMILSQLSNINYMSYAGLEARPVKCGEIEINPSLSDKDACDTLKELQVNLSCIPKLKSQFYSVNIEFGYYCDKTKLVKNSISYQTVGIIVGSIVFGQLSDLFGRKPVLVLCLTGTALLNFASSFANNLWTFTILRGIGLFFTGGQIAVMLVYLVETLPMKDRMWINAIVTWSPNYIIFAAIAYACQTWRLLAQVTSVCIIPAIVITLIIEESPRWLIQKKEIGKASKALNRIIKFENSKAECDSMVASIIANEQKISAEKNDTRRRYYVHNLFSTRLLSLYIMVFAFSYLTTSILNYGILFNIGGVAGSVYINYYIIGLVRWIVNVLFGYLDYKLKWFGRKVIHGISMTIMITVLIVISFSIILEICGPLCTQKLSGTAGRTPELIRYLTLSVSITSSHLFIVLNISSNELFPTPIRNIAFAFLQVTNRTGIALAPQLFALAEYWEPGPYAAMLIASSLSLVLFQFSIPETKNHPLQTNMPPSRTADIVIKSYDAKEPQNTDNSNHSAIQLALLPQVQSENK